jgi:hypothetical protein
MESWVARRLGHQDPATSERFYSHVEKGHSINLGEFYNDILNGKKTFSKEAQAKAEKEAIQLI